MPITDFWELVARTQRSLRLFIAGMGVQGADVDDVAQEAYLEYHRHPDRRPEGVSELAWLKGIARHRALDYFRARARAGHPLHDVVAFLADRPDPVDADDDGEARALRHCLDRLGAGHRRLIGWHYEDGLTSAQIAERAASTATSVRVTLQRLREALRDCIRRRRAQEEA